MQTHVEISMEDTDTLREHYQPTNQISEEVLALIKAWEEAFVNSASDLSLDQESNGSDLYNPTDLSEPPQRYRRKSTRPRKIMKID
jgi:hypothetical protein